MPIEITHAISSYNTRRYARPWIARVTGWPLGGKAVLAWGSTGRDGVTLTVAAEPGDVLFFGQKDARGSNSWARYGVAQADGTLEKITEAEARARFRTADHEAAPEPVQAAPDTDGSLPWAELLEELVAGTQSADAMVRAEAWVSLGTMAMTAHVAGWRRR